MIIGKEHNVDQLSQIYGEMNETGKEKLRQISRQMLNIWNIVNEGKTCGSPPRRSDCAPGGRALKEVRTIKIVKQSSSEKNQPSP